MLVLISGISAAGKNTVISKLMDKHPTWGGYKSYTTKVKDPRLIDNDDEGYFYISKEEFERKIRDGEIVEYAIVHNNNYYGTGKKELLEAMQKHEIVINDLDVIGTKAIRQQGFDMICIFINVSDDNELKRRLELRGATPEDISIRLSRATMERENMKYYDYIVDNIILEDCVNKVDEIINKELEKRKK